MTGLSYRSAVVATKGHYLPPDDYPAYCGRQIEDALGGLLIRRDSRVLEFGCGIGGYLLAISPRVGEGIGLDVNRGYIRIARRLANRFGCHNLRFVSYSGFPLPELGRFDLAFSVGVFERIPKEVVRQYLEWMAQSLVEDGTLVASFLTVDARASPFTHRLGDSAYVFWERTEAERVFEESGIRVLSARPLVVAPIAHVVTGRLEHGNSTTRPT
jgi:cyclopropane fatty-acyl-phospholipid synthase-like methyltransferase